MLIAGNPRQFQSSGIETAALQAYRGTMKNRIISGSVTIVLGLLIALGPQFIFRVCRFVEDNYPRCYWSAQAEIGMGMIIAALGVCLMVFDEQKTRLGLNIGIFLASIVVLFIPHALIGGCNMMSMTCRRVAFPALSVISILILVGAVANMFYLEGKTRKADKQEMAAQRSS